MNVYFGNCIELNIPLECILDCSDQGDVSEAVDFWHSTEEIDSQLSAIDIEDIKREVSESGRDPDDLAQYEEDDWRKALLWDLCCYYREELHQCLANATDDLTVPSRSILYALAGVGFN